MKDDFKTGLKHWVGTALVALIAGFVILGLLRGQEALKDFLKPDSPAANLEKGEIFVHQLPGNQDFSENSEESPRSSINQTPKSLAPIVITSKNPTPISTLIPTPVITLSPTPSKTPAPSPTPAKTPTPTPVLNPTLSPSPAPTPTPTPEPTPTPTPTPNPTPSPTSSPTPTPIPSHSNVNYILISEVQINNAEFVELYNPLNELVNLSGFYLSYYSSAKDWNDPFRNWQFPDNSTIPAKGYFLISVFDSGGSFTNPNWQLTTVAGNPYGSGQLSNSSGSIGVFPWDPKSKTPDEVKNGRIDAVAWGSVQYVKEGQENDVPSASQSLERKAWQDGCVSAQGAEESLGNGCDANNNVNDFEIRTISSPQNSQSQPEP